MTTHTPEQINRTDWILDPEIDPKGQRFIWYGDGMQDFVIATIHNDLPEFTTSNAALIAAAPDLLEACKLALALIRGEIYTIDAENRIVLPALRAAIKKAKGG